MGYDDIVPYLGEFGNYQKCIYFFVCLTAISCAFHKLAGVFLLAKPDFRCQLPFENDTENVAYELPEQIWALAYPKDPFTGKWSTCEYYDANFSMEYLNDNFSNLMLDDNYNNKSTIPCNKYVYDKSQYENSAVTEWNLICNRSWMSATSDSLFMFGALLGSIFFSQMSDKYGRKPIFFASLVIQLIFGLLASIAPEYITYTISRMIIGATCSGVFLVSYVIAMEMVGPKYRLIAGEVCMMFFSIGYMLTAVFAYYIKDWRWLQIGLTLPGIIFMSYYWFIPESTRWLILKNRKSDAIANIEKVARFNKVTVPVEIIENLLIDTEEKKGSTDGKAEPSVFDLFKYPNLRRKSLLIFFDWFVNSGTYYGLSWNTKNLGGNVLVNFVISGAVEIPAFIFLLLTLNRWGRRTILCGSMLTAGTALMLTIVVPNHMNWLIVLLAMIGKLAITSSYDTVYIFSAEQFPTVVRNVGMGTASMIGRIGGIMAPYFNMLSDVWRPLPLIIFGLMASIGGLSSLLLPETHNKPTLETIADGENFGQKAYSKCLEKDEDNKKAIDEPIQLDVKKT